MARTSKTSDAPVADTAVDPVAPDAPVADTAADPVTPSDDLVTEGQENDPATPPAFDKDGDDEAAELAAPGETVAGEKRIKVKTSGAFLVFDPYTLDSVGESGGEMRVTEFVRENLANGKLVEA